MDCTGYVLLNVSIKELIACSTAVTPGVGDCLCNIYARVMHMDVPSWKFTNRATNYDSI